MNKDILIGKTIQAATVMQLQGYDDTGFLRLDFTDGTSVTIVGTYGGFSGQSWDEYQTLIRFPTEYDDLENIPLIPTELDL